MQGLKLKGPARDVMVTPEGLAARQQQAVIAHHGLIAGLIGEHPAAGETCRLAKRWAASQLLSYHFPDELVELIVAATLSRCASLCHVLSPLQPPQLSIAACF